MSLPTAISTAAQTADSTGALVVATAPLSMSTSSTSSSTSTTPTSTTSTAAATTTASPSSSNSSSSDDAATKAGIALGVLGGLFVVLAFAYWLIVRRRKQIEGQQRREAADKEKFHGSDDDMPPPVGVSAARPPRLSLRMTGLFTGFNAPGQTLQHPSQKANKPIAMANTASTLRAPGASTWDRPMTSDSSSEHNPFGINAQVLVEPGTPVDLAQATTPVSETSLHMTSPEQRGGLAPAPRGSALTSTTSTTGRVSAVTMDSATVPPLVTSTLPHSPADSADVSPIESAYDAPMDQALTSSDTDSLSGDEVAIASTVGRQPSERRQSVRQSNVPAPLDLTLPPKLFAVPPSPAGTEYSMQEMDPGHSPIASSSAAAIAAAGGPNNSTVHRVQLDFKPTLDDEMGLQAGQLVRLLHEYDDGWALCIRLDRSEQGVVPRTCLSTRPVKPRTPPAAMPPRGPPVSAQGRPRGPSIGSQRAAGPQYGPGPAGMHGPGYMRPMVPGGRAAGPVPQARSAGGEGLRNQSPNGVGMKSSSPGPSNRQQEYRPKPNVADYYGAAASRAPPGQAY
ncbi:hypothetical protein BD289DRAFT_460074 [Coniella lustricola]|uniref:SH3 domain-containing protein n=1 Tax=Coniella lustricola TaxID=2025994 RepID=A0A2T3ABS3_9PEZI|nr:hypothetical protein BD289DRAFT_460074 [Coniella lustricola]